MNDLFNCVHIFKYPTYIVGGYVRDKIIDSKSLPKDIDLCMVVPNFNCIIEEIYRLNGNIYITKPEYATVRGTIPELGVIDITMARKDGIYSDGRRPDTIIPTHDIEIDLSRRDFTINAIAFDINKKEYRDPYGGISDISQKIIKCVGDAEDRFNEDYLRMLRAIRFSITKDFKLSSDIKRALRNPFLSKKIKEIKKERVREELYKCLEYDTKKTLKMFDDFLIFRNAIFSLDIWLNPTVLY